MKRSLSMILAVFLILLTACSVKSSRLTAKIPSEPEYAQVNIYPCTVIEGRRDANYIRVYPIGDKFATDVAYCMDEESVKNLLSNLIKVDIYKKQVLDVLRQIADVEILPPPETLPELEEDSAK